METPDTDGMFNNQCLVVSGEDTSHGEEVAQLSFELILTGFEPRMMGGEAAGWVFEGAMMG